MALIFDDLSVEDKKRFLKKFGDDDVENIIFLTKKELISRCYEDIESTGISKEFVHYFDVEKFIEEATEKGKILQFDVNGLDYYFFK